MLSASVIILEWICPLLGVLMANVMFLAPVKDVRVAVARGHLGTLNPTPWAFMLGNCVGWVAYSFLLQNLFIFFANAPGFLLAVWLNLCAAKLQYQTHKTEEMRKSLVLFLEEERSKQFSQPFTKDAEQAESPTSTFGDIAKMVLQVTTQETSAPAPHEQMVVAMVVIWTVVLSILGFASSLEARTKELIVGVIVNINVMFFYGAPLSSIVTVLKTKSSSSIHVATMATNTLNAIFWTAYGIAVVDPFLFVPNGMGAFFGACQIVLMVLFPRKPMEEMEDTPDNEKHVVASSVQSDNVGSTDSGGVSTLGGTIELDAPQAEP